MEEHLLHTLRTRSLPDGLTESRDKPLMAMLAVLLELLDEEPSTEDDLNTLIMQRRVQRQARARAARDGEPFSELLCQELLRFSPAALSPCKSNIAAARTSSLYSSRVLERQLLAKVASASASAAAYTTPGSAMAVGLRVRPD